ncbi:MAG: hypothetical protein R3E96_14690 [Planctomycetota bacterium]
MAVDLCAVVVRVDVLVVEGVELARQGLQQRVVLHVQLEAHREQPAVQFAVPDDADLGAGFGQDRFGSRAVGQAEDPVFFEVAVSAAQFAGEEGLQCFFRPLHAIGLVGASKENETPADPGAFADEIVPQRRRNVLEGIEGRDHVEATVGEGQGSATAKHQALGIGGVHVHQHDPVLGKERPEVGRAAAHVEDHQIAGSGQLLDHIGHQPVPLVLIEGQFEGVGHGKQGGGPMQS